MFIFDSNDIEKSNKKGLFGDDSDDESDNDKNELIKENSVNIKINNNGIDYKKKMIIIMIMISMN